MMMGFADCSCIKIDYMYVNDPKIYNSQVGDWCDIVTNSIMYFNELLVETKTLSYRLCIFYRLYIFYFHCIKWQLSKQYEHLTIIQQFQKVSAVHVWP